ncbi:hypothetical protein [Streptomyces sp. NPDC001508]|uniref:hypothetical protein n=1 Tax=Streptomyces sp. NPDC001508 TaxID=3154656 RepID=UPI0033256D8E
MGDDVVEFAGDTHTFLGDPAPGLLLPGPLGALRACLDPGEVPAAAADGVTQGGGRDREVEPQQAGAHEERILMSGGVDPGDRDGGGDTGDPGGTPAAAGGERVQGDEARGRSRGVAGGQGPWRSDRRPE